MPVSGESRARPQPSTWLQRSELKPLSVALTTSPGMPTATETSWEIRWSVARSSWEWTAPQWRAVQLHFRTNRQRAGPPARIPRPSLRDAIWGSMFAFQKLVVVLNYGAETE